MIAHAAEDPEGTARATDVEPWTTDPTFTTDVLRRADDLYRGQSSHSLMAMKVKTKHWTRTLALESWSLGTEYALVRILAPKKEKGTATLKSNTDLFTYLNKTERTIKITGGMMGARWMGSHFTNDDLIKETRLSQDYDVRSIKSSVVEGRPAYIFELTPKPDTPVVWGKIVLSVDPSNLIPIQEVFYDEDGEAIRILRFSDLRTIDDRIIPTVLRMTPLDEPDEYTEISYRTLEFDIEIERNDFSLQNLQRL